MIIWITPKWPLPPTDGARIATTQLLKHLTARGVKIHLCALVPEQDRVHADPEAAKRELGVEWVTMISRRAPSRLQQLMQLLIKPYFPITLSPFADSEVSQSISRFLIGRHFDYIVYDGLHAGAWALAPFTSPELKKLVVGREIYRAHNVESEIWFAGFRKTKNIFKKALMFLQGLLVRRVESKLLARAQVTFPVSFDDERRFSQCPVGGSLRTLPIGFNLKTLPITDVSPHHSRKFLFVGKLDWPPNRDGLVWLLRHVWPRALKLAPDLQLSIVGSGDGSWLEPFRNLQGIKIIGRVDDLAPYYRDCVATLIPVFYGSGIRVKAIESCLYRRTCISTRLGVEGMGLSPDHHYENAETVDEWINALIALDPHEAQQMADRAYSYASLAFDPERVASTFIQTLGMSEAVHAG